MRYARTKYGIYEVLTILTNGTTYITNKGAIDKKDILKQADTIEELCDWLVFKLNGEIKALYKNWDIALQCEGNHIAIYEDIYGAIDTDEGLTYVAKMNRKGELELL